MLYNIIDVVSSSLFFHLNFIQSVAILLNVNNPVKYN